MPASPKRAAATQQAHQHQLSIVVLVVPQRNPVEPARHGRALQETIAHLAGGLFRAHPVGLPKGLGRIGFRDERNAQAIGQAGRMPGIAGGPVASQTVIQVRGADGNGQPGTQLVKTE